MSYNMRRGPGAGGGYANSSANVGQRRPNNPSQAQLSNNFVPGGQISGQQQGNPRQQGPPQKPQQQRANTRQAQFQAQQQQHQPPAQQQQHQPPPQQQQHQPPPQQQPPAQQPQPQQQQQQQQQQPQQQQPPKVVFEAKDSLPPPASLDHSDANDSESMDASVDGTERKFKKNKPFWMQKREGLSGKVNKKERLRRRNQRLRKILQPKNALMVLNELIGSATYNMSESLDMYEGTLFKCSVVIDGVEHIGAGKSKPAAKTAAAEAALKHMVLSKLKNAQSLDGGVLAAATANESNGTNEGSGEVVPEVKMEIDDDNLGGISWSHVACYALHKLLTSWDEGTNFAEKLIEKMVPNQKTPFNNEQSKILLQLAQVAAGGATVTSPDKAKPFEKKPAKKLPESAPTMNPIMLLNQMHPNAVYEEVAKAGNPPNVKFTMKCTVGEEGFLGTASTKKGARKMCAFAACQKLLEIKYTPAFLEEHGFTEDSVSTCPPTPAAPSLAVA